MGGLESHKGEEGGYVGGLEQILRDNDLDDVVHSATSTKRTAQPKEREFIVRACEFGFVTPFAKTAACR